MTLILIGVAFAAPLAVLRWAIHRSLAPERVIESRTSVIPSVREQPC